MISKDHIFLERTFADQEEVFQFLADKTEELAITDSSAAVLEALKIRESEGTTGMMDGFAIPHAKSAAITKPSIIITTFTEGIYWDSLDGELIFYAIALFIPDGEAGTTHLQLLSKIARMLMKQEFKEAFKAAKTPEDLNELLTNYLDGE
ncbi:fructose PTS transporter subunit IIA [Enterococcus sp. BWT-B8]|uniref:fructose PTS transporter subunit IIA n=1 Tax=Enterococcus sp. BWT-B8 TaxID=2885157 RepID=UPI001E30E7BB|nr:fructose PTS transporter subunit IIA [Enterococcus sp. BWT-B8]MCB5951380.1 fructose PTS transporter subunit IIA [Enterococcus sp. BWT-B8]